jgi:hypothetical protein
MPLDEGFREVKIGMRVMAFGRDTHLRDVLAGDRRR